jgi:DNA-binding NarL/FixJ family response regulator
MIRRGLASKEIAHVLHISPSTVSRHREHIRQKLGLTNKGTNLVSHLNAMLASRGTNET